jgi:hypothetical protein
VRDMKRDCLSSQVNCVPDKVADAMEWVEASVGFIFGAAVLFSDGFVWLWRLTFSSWHGREICFSEVGLWILGALLDHFNMDVWLSGV